jgi:nucleotide-binding universal stress UspA family protein
MTANNTMHVLMPLINLSNDRAAFPVARAMARILNAPLQVVAAGGQAPSAQELARRWSVPPEEVNAVAIEEASGDLAEAVIHRVGISRPAMLVLAIRLHDEIAESEAQPMGAIGWQVLEKITCPILIVPPHRDMHAWRLRRELLPQDGTPGCAAALAQVINQSRQIGIENIVLRVAGAKVSQPTEPGSLATPRYVDHPEYEWEAWGREFLDRIFGMGANLNQAGLKLLMATGEPATEILRVAQEQGVDMIILPWHCALGPGRARMVKTVLHRASCPVLLLPECGSHRGIKEA